MQIDLLYFDDCPEWEEALKNLQVALAAEGLPADIRLIRMESDAEATRLKFLGSPSFRVNGMDLWHEPRQRYNLSCRLYSTPQGLRGAPTVEMLREKLHKET
jgi:hypothetical protein